MHVSRDKNIYSCCGEVYIGGCDCSIRDCDCSTREYRAISLPQLF